MRKKWKGRKALLHKLVHEIGRCHYCSLTVEIREAEPWHPRRATLDHKTPRHRSRDDSEPNLVLACGLCNHEKGALTYDEYILVRQFRVRHHGKSRRELLAMARALLPIECTSAYAN